MRCEVLKVGVLFFLLCTAAALSGDEAEQPTIPESVPCVQAAGGCTYCFGPDETASLSPVYPRTGSYDVTITFNPFYWKAEQEGMTLAIQNQVQGADTSPANLELNNLIQARYLTPHFGWNFGFQLGLGYRSGCDGWDVSLLWTRFSQTSHTDEEAETDSQTLLPLWSNFQFPLAGDAPILFANEVLCDFHLDLNLVDLSLARAAWVSHLVSLSPRIGVRLCHIKQEFDIEYRGGSWNNPNAGILFSDWIELTSDFKAVGPFAGADTTWNLACGFSLFGNGSVSILYGRFQLDHIEWFCETTSPFQNIRDIDLDEKIRVCRGMLDLLFGVQWSALFGQGCYGLTVGLAFEEHIFFNQNMFWQISRIGGENDTSMLPFNDSGDNLFVQSRGNLFTSGVTLRATFEF